MNVSYEVFAKVLAYFMGGSRISGKGVQVYRGGSLLC